MKFAHWRFALPAAALMAAAVTPALAQRAPAPDPRITMLQQQLAASQASNMLLQQRLDALERQLQQLVNQGEMDGHRMSELESAVSNLRNDTNKRLTALENRPVIQPAPANDPPEEAASEAEPKRTIEAASTSTSDGADQSEESTETAAADPGEDAYSEGYHLWRDGKYDRAITALRAFVSAFPDHRRVSFAKNLIGRALLDKGQPRPAAEALLANYRSNPKGERAPDSLYYLGQALMQLDQASQACKAYAELEDVYGSSVRPELETLVTKGKAEAHCS
ncbi:MAG TPA: tetratricopeptide repeat protein [Sphingomicrobium sp.]|nr:tetratricopeptide repeat protein [Sphingomicrobium sp.]